MARAWAVVFEVSLLRIENSGAQQPFPAQGALGNGPKLIAYGGHNNTNTKTNININKINNNNNKVR